MLSLTNPQLTTSTLKNHFNDNLPPTARYPKWFTHLTFTKWHCEIWSSQSSDYTGYCLLGLMCRVTQIYQRFKQTYCIHPQGRAQAGSNRLFQNSTFLPDYVVSNATGVSSNNTSHTCSACLILPDLITVMILTGEHKINTLSWYKSIHCHISLQVPRLH